MTSKVSSSSSESLSDESFNGELLLLANLEDVSLSANLDSDFNKSS